MEYDWTIQPFKQTSLDPNIAVGDTVKVEANVLADGAVIALKIESSANDDVVMFQVRRRAVMIVRVVAAKLPSQNDLPSASFLTLPCKKWENGVQLASTFVLTTEPCEGFVIALSPGKPNHRKVHLKRDFL